MLKKLKSMLGRGSGSDATVLVPRTRETSLKFVNAVTGYEGVLAVGDSVELEWELAPGLNGLEVIDAVSGGCTCTSTGWDERRVWAVFKNTASALKEPGQVKKSVTVYEKDGVGMVPNGRGGMMWGPGKKSLQLQFVGMVGPAKRDTK